MIAVLLIGGVSLLVALCIGGMIVPSHTPTENTQPWQTLVDFYAI